MEPNRGIDPRRLDVVLAEIARTTTDPVTRARVEGFEALIRSRFKEPGRRGFDSVREEVVDFVMPRISNAGILGGARYLEILDRVVAFLPALGESDDIIEIAIHVIEEEMDRHRELQDRIHQALGA